VNAALERRQHSEAVLARLDAFHRRHVPIAFSYGVLKRYSEDRGAWLAASISYYGFLSLMPCLVAFVTIVYWLFDETPSLMRQILDALWTALPFVGAEVERRVQPVEGKPAVVIASLAVSLWGAIGVIRALQDTLNIMWGVPRYRRPAFLPKVFRGLVVLALGASGVLVAAVAAAIIVASGLPFSGVVVTAALAVTLNIGLVLGLFSLLTARRLPWRQHFAGAVVTAIAVAALTIFGGIYVDRVVARASALYGSFASVIGLFAWISLVVQSLVIGNLVNVVRSERLWPRSLSGPPSGAGDSRAYELTVRRERLVSPEADGGASVVATDPERAGAS
jgi:membrane protein